jgi:hypothetical protein
MIVFKVECTARDDDSQIRVTVGLGQDSLEERPYLSTAT